MRTHLFQALWRNRLPALAALALLASAPAALAASGAACSPPVLVDTRNAPLPVSGRVVSAATGAPVSGAAVSLAAAVSTTDASGRFAFAGATGRPLCLTVSLPGWATHRLTLDVPPGAQALALPLIRLAPADSRPVVTALRARAEGLFLAGLSFPNEYTASVDWSGLLPGRVEFALNGAVCQTITTTNSEAAAALDLGLMIPAGPCQLTATAVDASGLRSAPLALDLSLLAPPPFLSPALAQPSPDPAFPVSAPAYSFEFSIPGGPGQPPAVQPVPFLGQLGLQTRLGAQFNQTLAGAWALQAATGPLARPVFLAGDAALDCAAPLQASGAASPLAGTLVPKLPAALSLEGERPLAQVSLAAQAPSSQWARVREQSALLGADLAGIPALPIRGSLYAPGTLTADFSGPASFDPAVLSLQLGFHGQFEASQGTVQAAALAGGALAADCVTTPPSDSRLDNLGGAVWAGTRLDAWLLALLDEQFVLLQDPAAAPGSTSNWAATALAPAGVTAIDRSYAAAGPGQFTTNTADPVLVWNVFPRSQPALASAGSRQMLLYTADSGQEGPLQFTDIHWSLWDGTNWSAPLPIHTNSQAEFAPQAAFDGQGAVLAVWERVADPAFNQTNLAAMAAQMEIVWARWDPATGLWSAPAALTDNAVLDHQPLLRGPDANGDLILVWTRNSASQLLGGAASSDTVLWTRWNAAAAAWAEPQTLVAGLPFRLSQSLAVSTNRAVYAWTQDLDGLLDGPQDQQLFFIELTNGLWGAPVQATDSPLGNRNVRVALTSSGVRCAVWQQGTNWVAARDESAPAAILPPELAGQWMADVELSAGPEDRLALVWQGPAGASRLFYDPAAAVWGQPELLAADNAPKRSFASAWDAQGGLVTVCDRVLFTLTNKTFSLPDGRQAAVSRIPVATRVDLTVYRRAWGLDLALLAGDFTVEGRNCLPGDPLKVSVRARNTGTLTARNVTARLFLGDPGAGGVCLTNLPLALALPSGALAERALFTFVVPEPAGPRALFAVVNHDGLAGETDPSNNTQSVSFGNPDLTVALVSHQEQDDGAVSLIVRVQNLGGPIPANTTLAVARGTTLLAQIVVPPLPAGCLAQVAADLPPGTQPPGEALYRLTAGDPGLDGDANPLNNETVFIIRRSVDGDSDGMPDAWELAYGLDPANPADALLDSDLDGLPNWAEYRAGTDPNDPASVLRFQTAALDGMGGIILSWGSISNRVYTLQRSGGLASGAFTNWVEHIPATPPVNVWTDPAATSSDPLFYRIQAE